jgi:hypothetical protein
MGILIRSKELRHLTYFQPRYASFKKMTHLSPEASNAFQLPLFEISILEDKKGPGGVCYILPTVKKTAR